MDAIRQQHWAWSAQCRICPSTPNLEGCFTFMRCREYVYLVMLAAFTITSGGGARAQEGCCGADAEASQAGPRTPGILRITADPNNLPFSNNRLEGFENKIAELL